MQSVSYMGDGSTTEFMFNFPYYENSNIIVTLNNTIAPGYTIIGTPAGVNADIPYTGGKVVFDVAPTALDSIKISRDLPLTRVVDYQPTAQLNPTTLNQDMNYMMEVLKDIKDEFDNLSTRYAEIADQESTTALLARIDEISNEISDVNETITDFNTEIEHGRIMSKDDFYSYTTNSVTEIPQDIKLELTDGVLTLKSGSKVYLPNGSGVFDAFNITEDKTTTYTNNGARMVFINSNGALLIGDILTRTVSGAEDSFSGETYHIWYDTTNNFINRYNVSGSVPAYTLSLPLAIVTVSNNTISSIDKIFNGFGYIGSTIFALPGVSVLAPNGLNAKGILNNTHWTTTNVITYTHSTGSETVSIAININNNSFSLGTYTYNQYTNYNYHIGALLNNSVIVGTVTLSSGVITATEFKKVFSLKTN